MKIEIRSDTIYIKPSEALPRARHEKRTKCSPTWTPSASGCRGVRTSRGSLPGPCRTSRRSGQSSCPAVRLWSTTQGMLPTCLEQIIVIVQTFSFKYKQFDGLARQSNLSWGCRTCWFYSWYPRQRIPGAGLHSSAASGRTRWTPPSRGGLNQRTVWCRRRHSFAAAIPWTSCPWNLWKFIDFMRSMSSYKGRTKVGFNLPMAAAMAGMGRS